MKLSTKSRYGTRAMIDIATNGHRGNTMLKDISERQAISPKYLDHILSSLRKAGLIKNVRGKGGGYFLSRPADTITLKEIFNAVEDSLAPVPCVENTDTCGKTDVCSSRDVWVKIKDAIENVLEETTLQELVENQDKKNSDQVNYCI